MGWPRNTVVMLIWLYLALRMVVSKSQRVDGWVARGGVSPLIWMIDMAHPLPSNT